MQRVGLQALAITAAFTVVSLVPSHALAQTPIHFAAGPTMANISTDEFDGAESKIGFFAAVGTSFNLSETVMLSPYVAYTQKGAEFPGGEEASYNYIEIPVLLGVGFPVGENLSLNVFGGPQVGLQVSCDEDGFDCTEFSNHKSTEFGVIAGAGLQFPMGSGALAASIGADLGLSNIFDEIDYKTRTYFLSLQYTVIVGGQSN